MIYLITGIPGSGKTLYAVSTLIKSLMADKMTGADGKPVERRLVVDGIPALTIPHEMMAKTIVDEKTITVEEGGHGVGNWWEWCKPGDVIVIDEVQRIWRPRAMGSKPPRMVTELETHRHKGVDLVLITQSPMLMDQNVRRLVGRHQHVRRLFGMARALIYDWDGCQADVHRVASANKTMWAYPKDAYKLYASSELHTKQKQKFPIWAALPVVALVAGLFIAPKAFSVLSGAATGKGITEAVHAPGKPASAPVLAASAPAAGASEAVAANDAPEEILPDVPALPAGISKSEGIAGCIRAVGKCVCFDGSGSVAPVAVDICETKMTGWMPDRPKTDGDAAVLARIPELYEPANQLVHDHQMQLIRDSLRKPGPSVDIDRPDLSSWREIL